MILIWKYIIYFFLECRTAWLQRLRSFYSDFFGPWQRHWNSLQFNSRLVCFQRFRVKNFLVRFHWLRVAFSFRGRSRNTLQKHFHAFFKSLLFQNTVLLRAIVTEKFEAADSILFYRQFRTFRLFMLLEKKFTLEAKGNMT